MRKNIFKIFLVLLLSSTTLFTAKSQTIIAVQDVNNSYLSSPYSEFLIPSPIDNTDYIRAFSINDFPYLNLHGKTYEEAMKAVVSFLTTTDEAKIFKNDTSYSSVIQDEPVSTSTWLQMIETQILAHPQIIDRYPEIAYSQSQISNQIHDEIMTRNSKCNINIFQTGYREQVPMIQFSEISQITHSEHRSVKQPQGISSTSKLNSAIETQKVTDNTILYLIALDKDDNGNLIESTRNASCIPMFQKLIEATKLSKK